MGYSLWHRKQSDTTEQLSLHFTSLHFFLNRDDPKNKLMKLSNHIGTLSFLECFYLSYEISE